MTEKRARNTMLVLMNTGMEIFQDGDWIKASDNEDLNDWQVVFHCDQIVRREAAKVNNITTEPWVLEIVDALRMKIVIG